MICLTLTDLYNTVDLDSPKERNLSDIEIILSTCYSILTHKVYADLPIFKPEGLGFDRADIERTILDLKKFPKNIKGEFKFLSKGIELAITQAQAIKIYFETGHENHGLNLNFGGMAFAAMATILQIAKDGLLMVKKRIITDKLETLKSPKKKIELLIDFIVDWKQDKDFLNPVEYEKIAAFLSLELEREKQRSEHIDNDVARFRSEHQLFNFLTGLIKNDLQDSIRLDEGYRNFWRDEKCTDPKKETEIHQFIKAVLAPACRQNAIKITRESFEANGFVDLSFIHHNFTICMEVKLADHNDVEKGVHTQLPAYMDGSRTRHGIYLVIWHKSPNGYSLPSKYENAASLKESLNEKRPSGYEIFVEIIDCSKPTPPSKL